MKKIFLVFFFSYFLYFSYSFASVSQPPVISREQRWADESLRLWTPPVSTISNDESKGSDSNTITAVQKRSIADSYLINKFPQEFRSDSTIRTRNNKFILWPIQINNKKAKIIIHHTARAPVTNSYEDVITELQDIYRFHTINRRRGDIGYNYIIWPNGEIFEGRAGGPSAVAAHAVNNNWWSIGISLMGNFELTEPSPEQLQSLIKLTARLADAYSINVYNKVSYHTASKEDPYITDHSNDSLVGHKDAWDTACPGKNLYKKLSTIKSQVIELLWSKAPNDPTPIVTDPVRYYIPSTSYQLSIPRTMTNSITSCDTNNTIWSIKKCSLSQWYLTLNLSKSINQAHQWTHRVTIKTTKGNIYLYVSLEYIPRTASLIEVQSIPSTNKIPDLSKISVMLYELSTTQNAWNLYCAQWCTVMLWSQTVKLPLGTRFTISSIPRDKSLFFHRNNTKYLIPSISVSALGSSSVTIEDYWRSQWDIKLNQRQWSLTRSLQEYKPINKPSTSGIVIQNIVRVDDYMRWLVLTTTNTPQSYHDVMYLIAHNNLYYRSWIVSDDPRIHQYYGWSNASKLDYKRQLSNDTNHNMFLKNGNNLTYAPWFECSDGITRNGVVDIGVCSDGKLSGPWLWLSRLWALMLAQRWYSTRQIIDYYYPGVTID